MSQLVLHTNSNLVFKVRRQEAEVIRPAIPTPKEVKLLSDIDDQEGLRFHIHGILIYPPNGRNEINGPHNHPAKGLRAALAQALVYYYPLAGRLREMTGRKLAVDCTGEMGVMMVEADADVRLEEFGEEICPPLPCYEEFFCKPPNNCDSIFQSPLIFFQVTRLLCGGFILATRTNHTVCDGVGLHLLMKTVADIAKKGQMPTILPVWNRELIMARDPPQVTCTHDREYDIDHVSKVSNNTKIEALNPSINEVRSFFFGPNEVSALRRLIIPSSSIRRGYHYSAFDLIAACLWRCHTIALQYKPDDEVRLVLTVNARSKFHPPLPTGYYGNAFAYSAAVTTAEKLSNNPPLYALQLIRNAKEAITVEHMRSLPDFLAVKGRPKLITDNTYFVSDMRRTGFGSDDDQVDFGWGTPAYVGATNPRMTTFFLSYSRKTTGTQGILVPVTLPHQAMERFTDELGVIMLMETHASTKILSSI